MDAIDMNICEVPTVCRVMDIQDLANSLAAQSSFADGFWQHRTDTPRVLRGSGGITSGWVVEWGSQLASHYLHQLHKAANKSNPK